jgi:hypothetical protein
MHFVRHGRARELCAVCVLAVVAACADGGVQSRVDAASSASANEEGAERGSGRADAAPRADNEAEDAGARRSSDDDPGVDAAAPDIDAETASPAPDASSGEDGASGEDGGAAGEAGSDEDGAAPSEAAVADGAAPSEAAVADGAAALPDASPPASKLCKETCSVDQDCWEAEFGFESCVQGRCSAQCASDDACSDKGAQGRRACARDAECRSGQVCVTLGNGAGRCATAAAAGPCAAHEWPRMRPRAEDGAATEVCMTSLRCAAAGCVAPCAGSCDAPGEPRSCDAATGLCICRSDADCAEVSNAPSCDVASGRCVCKADADCKVPEAPSCDVATGACGCSADAQCGVGALCRDGACVQICEEASTCLPLFFGTTLSCE